MIALMTSALLRNGIGYIAEVVRGLEEWMTDHNVETIREIQGRMSHRCISEPAAFERANYLRVLNSYP
jgi:dihydroorotate dehydrogenase (fumarate)